SSKSRLVSVLGTEATVKREYTRKLIRDFGQGCEIALIGSARLASLAEAALRDEPVEEAAIVAEIAPCFIARGERRTDTVALACTHYPLLLDHFERLAPWPVAWIDPAPAIARRVVQLLGPVDATNAAARGARDRIVFTSERPPSQALAKALERFGLRTDDAAVGEADQAALRQGTSIDTRFL
ncbi:MAG: aspartate/glutamate racemase family protein, partial [Rhodoplanes sp.]